MNKKRILSEIEAHKKDICKFDAERIGLFGSYAKGTQKRESDIDFLVKFQKKNL